MVSIFDYTKFRLSKFLSINAAAICLIFISLSLPACSEKNNEADIIIDYNTEIQPKATKVSTTAVSLPEDFIFATNYWMISDSILAIGNRKEAGNFLDFVNPSNGRKYASLLGYGEGPDEMIMGALYFDGQNFTCVDYIRSRYSKFSPQEALHPEFKPVYTDYPREIGVTTPPIGIGDTTYIVNPYHYINKTHDIEQKEPRLFLLSGDNENIDLKPGLLFTQNVSQVIPLVDEINKRIWLFCREKSIIDIFDYNTEKIITLKISDELDRDPDVAITDENCVLYKGKYPTAFTNAIINYDDQEILAVYNGKLCKPEDIERVPSKIFVFDLDGNLKRSYSTDSYIHNLSKTEDGIYATIHDEEDMPVFVKFE